MRYVYENREGEQEEFSQSLCESVIDRFGYKLIGHKIGGKLYSAERGRRVRAAQSEAFDEMLNKKIWEVDDRTQLKLWGLQ